MLVSPAPGQPGKMPFWHGDRPGRPPELGRAVGALARELAALPLRDAEKRLADHHGLDQLAAQNLARYLADQVAATGEVPSDRAIVIERCLDELGDYRVCVLSPFGARVHAPWCTAILGRLRAASDAAIEGVWSDDGMVFRLPGSDEPPPIEPFFPRSDEIEDLVIHSLGSSSIFAARFRENAGRALLLPKRRPGMRSPLWSTRKKAADLLAVASRFGSFPLILETYRECLRDVFDLPGLVDIFRQIEQRKVRVITADSRAPSPFAASLLFSYVASFIYDGDAPLAERRAHALSIDTAELRELLGEADLSELLDPEAITETALALQRLDGRRSAESPDGLHDLLLALGDLSEAEVQRRSSPPEAAPGWIAGLERERRIFAVSIAGEQRFVAAEDAARLRDALGIAPPRGLPAALLEPVADPLGDLVSRYARTHGPFRVEDVAARFGLGTAPVRTALDHLAAAGRVACAMITPGRRVHEWCDAEVLRSLKRRSLARLRREVEPVEPAALGRFLLEWHGLSRPRAGADALLSVVEQLQGAPSPPRCSRPRSSPRASRTTAPAISITSPPRARSCGSASSRSAPGRADRALPRRSGAAPRAPDAARRGRPPGAPPRPLPAARRALLRRSRRRDPRLRARAPRRALGSGLGRRGLQRHPRSAAEPARGRGRGIDQARLDARAILVSTAARRPSRSEGRWSLIARGKAASETSRRAALTRALLDRHGVLTREAVAAEGLDGGFTSIYEVLKAMEQSARVRRGYFVAGLGATQFALPGADDRLRACRDPHGDSLARVLAAMDPANPYGAALPWPWPDDGRDGARPQRAAGAQVILHDGNLLGYLGRTEKDLLTFLPEWLHRLEPLGARAGAGPRRARRRSRPPHADPGPHRRRRSRKSPSGPTSPRPGSLRAAKAGSSASGAETLSVSGTVGSAGRPCYAAAHESNPRRRDLPPGHGHPPRRRLQGHLDRTAAGEAARALRVRGVPLLPQGARGAHGVRSRRDDLPCPRGGRLREVVKQRGGKYQFPYLVDPNTGKEMYESDDIIRYLATTYRDGKAPLTLGPLTIASGGLAAVLRAGRGRKVRPSHPPEKPLELWSFEASPYSASRARRSMISRYRISSTTWARGAPGARRSGPARAR